MNSNDTIRLFCDVAVPIPADAAKNCHRCGQEMDVLDDLHIDEGDGSAMVGLRCGQCRIESVHYWAPSDEVYENVFGHAFDDIRDDDDDTAVPSGSAAGGDLVGTGDITNIEQTRKLLTRFAVVATEFVTTTDALTATLSAKGIDSETLGDLMEILDAATATSDAARNALDGLNQRHHALETAVNATHHAAKTNFYRH
jgi:hypothetical protein